MQCEKIRFYSAKENGGFYCKISVCDLDSYSLAESYPFKEREGRNSESSFPLLLRANTFFVDGSSMGGSAIIYVDERERERDRERDRERERERKLL